MEGQRQEDALSTKIVLCCAIELYFHFQQLLEKHFYIIMSPTAIHEE